MNGYLVTSRPLGRKYRGADSTMHGEVWPNLEEWNIAYPSKALKPLYEDICLQSISKELEEYLLWIRAILTDRLVELIYFDTSIDHTVSDSHTLLGYDCMFLELDMVGPAAFSSLYSEAIALKVDLSKHLNENGLFEDKLTAVAYIEKREEFSKDPNIHLETAYAGLQMRIVKTFSVKL